MTLSYIHPQCAEVVASNEICFREFKAGETGEPSLMQAAMQCMLLENLRCRVWFTKLVFIVYLRRLQNHGSLKKI